MSIVSNGLFDQFLQLLGIQSNTYLVDIILASVFTSFIVVACVSLMSFVFKLLCYRK